LTTARNLKDLPVSPNVPANARSLCIAVIVSLFSLALAHWLAPLEDVVLQQITPALADLGLKLPGTEAKSGQFSSFVQFLILFGTAVAAAESGLRLKSLAKLIAPALILFLGSCFVQTALFVAFSITPLFATTIVVTILGAAGGLLVEQYLQKQKLMESKTYELFLRNEELGKARLDLVRQDETARRVLAADLHDQVLNDLKKIMETFNKFEKDPNDREASGAIRAGFNKTLTDIREIMDDLCPIMLQNFGMRAAVEDCLEKGKERSGFDIKFDCTVDDEVLEKLTEVEQALLFRLAQESITNISKHAKARNVAILIERNKDNLNISIEDDGVGIDYKTVSHQSRGLSYMKLRADLIDAAVEWKPGREGKGTKVVIIFPLPV